MSNSYQFTLILDGVDDKTPGLEEWYENVWQICNAAMNLLMKKLGP